MRRLLALLFLAVTLTGCRQDPAPGREADGPNGGVPAGQAADQLAVAAESGTPAESDPSESAPSARYVSVATGDYHGCAAAADGRVYCWGDDAVGQLGGGGDGGDASLPRLVPLDLDAVQVTAGAVHTCARSGDGQVACWGGNLHGQIRQPASPGAGPARVPLPGPAVAIDAGTHHTCAVLEDDRALCWGRNYQGLLGTGDTVSSSDPRPVAGTARFRAVSAGTDHACAVDTEGGLHCWGDGAASPEPLAMPAPVRSVSAGDGSTCVITEDQRAWCWGANYAGQAGVGRTEGRVPEPVAVAGEHRFRRVVAGRVHRCGLTTESRLVCWGMDPEHGRLLGGAAAGETCQGGGPVACATRPVPVLPGQRFADVAASEFFSCAAAETGGVLCWGDNEYRRLGTDAVGPRSDTPVAVELPRE